MTSPEDTTPTLEQKRDQRQDQGGDLSAAVPTLRLAPPLEIKIADSEHEGVISGYASIFVGQSGGGPDSYGDVIARSAFTATLAEHKLTGTTPAIYVVEP